jgi:hypothetical protein
MLEHIEADRITVEMAVAPIALALASHPKLESYDLSSLRFVMWGATPVTPSVAEIVTRRTGVGWLPAYGASELPVITCNPLDQPRLDSAGRAVPGVSLRVVSLETGAPVGPGETGEIQARSKSLMAGYLPAEATAAAFCDGWYRTGDVGHIDAGGWLRLTDRSKEMIKVRGFQVAPAEVEAILHSHPAVADCAVFGISDPANGEAVIAAITPGEPVDPAELIALVGDKLASYKRPSRVVLIDEIPRLPSGKVLRRVLKEQYGRAFSHLSSRNCAMRRPGWPAISDPVPSTTWTTRTASRGWRRRSPRPAGERCGPTGRRGWKSPSSPRNSGAGWSTFPSSGPCSPTTCAALLLGTCLAAPLIAGVRGRSRWTARPWTPVELSGCSP